MIRATAYRLAPEIDPGLGYDVRPGTVHLFVHVPIDTGGWRIEDVSANKERVRDLFVTWHRERLRLVPDARVTG